MPSTTFGAASNDGGNSWHIIPADDLIQHDMDENCPCMPDTVLEPEGPLYRHHSLDGREVNVPEGIDSL